MDDSKSDPTSKSDPSEPLRQLRTSVLSRRGFVAALAGAGVLAACGSSESDTATEGATSGGDAAPEVLTTGGRDLGGVTLNPESQTATNVLPDLIVDDIGRFKKVNVRNIFPAERPVLIWMWAPY